MEALKPESISKIKKLPSWFKKEIPNASKVKKLKDLLEEQNLCTVCQSALCPNLGECWERGTATFMILGDCCTRACRFCAVMNARPLKVNQDEPRQVAEAIKALELHYAVITSVTRDDLADKGCEQFVQTIFQVRHLNPRIKIEVLIPDFNNDKKLLQTLVSAKPDVIGHNIETVKRLYSFVRPQADYQTSLGVLKNLKQINSGCLSKSGFMVGLGERFEEVLSLMKDLQEAQCDLLTIGQYLSPRRSERHVPEDRFVSLGEFQKYKDLALDMGFKFVSSGPCVRSSYLAEQAFYAVGGK